MINPEIFSFITKDNIKLDMNLYRSKNNRKDITILYFHGGGLLYGVRDDLPNTYLDKFLDSGYDFLALDYPLAPESKLEVILESSFSEIIYFLENKKTIFSLENNKYILFGRSAGAYLCFMLCQKLIENNCTLPSSIISLYGYTRLDEIEFNTPSKHYNKLGKISNNALNKIISNKPTTYGPMNERFSLYVNARQQGSWVKDIIQDDDMSKYLLDECKLKNFPRTIFAAATLDPDVPYKISKKLSKVIPYSRLLTIYDEVHDFDRNPENSSSIFIYEEILNWLNGM